MQKENWNEYYKIHSWLRYHYGSANHCENSDCKKLSQKYNWCLKHDYVYEKNKNNFIQLCRSCHALYDNWGHLHTDKTKRKLSESYTEERRLNHSKRMKEIWKLRKSNLK